MLRHKNIVFIPVLIFAGIEGGFLTGLVFNYSGFDIDYIPMRLHPWAAFATLRAFLSAAFQASGTFRGFNYVFC